MWRGVKAGLVYFAIVFAAGFLLGILRVLAVAPRLGESSAVLIELPVMLAVAWVTCGWLIRRYAVNGALAPRLIMGGVAFVMLMPAEMGVAVFGFEQTVVQHVAAYSTVAAVLGLWGQIAFALFPVVQLFARRVDAGRE
jgi:hypothetical protein